jgi:hypothetical protein
MYIKSQIRSAGSPIKAYNDIWTLSVAQITYRRMLGLPVNSESKGCGRKWPWPALRLHTDISDGGLWERNGVLFGNLITV